MKRIRAALALALAGGALLIGSCTSGEGGQSRYVWVADGDQVSCINANRIRGFNVINDRTIDFEMTGNQRFRNEMPMRCDNLAFGMRIRHNARGSQLCQGDSITVMGMGAPSSMNRNCPLGRFQPLSRVAVPAAAG